MVRNQHDALWKVALEPSILCLPELSANTLIPAHSHPDGSPPVCHGGCDDAKVLFGHGHPSVEEVLAVEIERSADPLGDADTEAGR